MEAQVVTDPWNSGHAEASTTNTRAAVTGGGPVESSTSSTSTAPIEPGTVRQVLRQALGAVGLTVADLEVISTIGSAVSVMVAAASVAGWI